MEEFIIKSEEKIFHWPITQKTCTLYKHVVDLHDVMPKRYRAYLWEDMYKQAGYVMCHVIRAMKSSAPKAKNQALAKVSEQLSMLQVNIHLAYSLQGIAHSQYETIQKLIDEIGRMAGGLMKYIRT